MQDTVLNALHILSYLSFIALAYLNGSYICLFLKWGIWVLQNSVTSQAVTVPNLHSALRLQGRGGSGGGQGVVAMISGGLRSRGRRASSMERQQCKGWKLSSSCPTTVTGHIIHSPWTRSMCAKSLQSCPALCNPMDSSLPGSCIHGILQATILGWAAMPSSRASSWHRDRIHVSCL